jgi:hypothetical protein
MIQFKNFSIFKNISEQILIKEIYINSFEFFLKENIFTIYKSVVYDD